MTPEQAAELRRPFPPSVVGKLPRGGIQLDYVGHAAVTDRLLSVDPSWTYEFLAFDPETGLPAYDRAGGLWIKLTVHGVTRYGYGDGPDPKQRVSDAIRNAAMRFGVALDLWTKDELESHVDVAAHNAAQEAAYEPPAAPEPTDEDYLAAWREHLFAGPEDKSTKGALAFFAKATAAIAKRRMLEHETTDQAGTPMTVKALIEQEQLRYAA